MVDSDRLVDIRDRLVSQKALADSAKANNAKAIAMLKDKIGNINPDTLTRLQENGFDVLWLKSIEWESLSNPVYMKTIKRKNIEVISQISEFLEKYLESQN